MAWHTDPSLKHLPSAGPMMGQRACSSLLLNSFSSSLQNRAYNVSMHVAIFFFRLLEILFFTGLAGSAVVILISFVEDFKELFGED
jgi:hypothetical protein